MMQSQTAVGIRLSAKARTWLVGLALAVVTFLVYWPACQFEFLNWDDLTYVSTNDHVRGGLSWKGFLWSFTHSYSSNWHPLTWLSHMLDCQLYGLRPAGHHLTNVLLHAANSVLLFLVLRALTAAPWRSAVVAALFALHPLHVESVAWVAERKDVLSALFFMLTLWAYARHVEDRRQPRIEHGLNTDESRQKEAGGIQKVGTRFHPPSSIFYLSSLLFFALGLMSKPMLVTLPFVLLLLDYWPLRRLELSTQDAKPETRCARPRTLPCLLFEKLPFFALSAISCVVTWLAQTKGQAVASFERLPFGNRVAYALAAYTDYLQQAFWPAKLCVFYPLPAELPAIRTIGSATFLAAVTAAVLLLARRRRWAPVGWFWYLGMLVPVIGMVQVGEQARADRYTYLPLIGIFILVAWGVGALVRTPSPEEGQEPKSGIRKPKAEVLRGLAGAAAGAGLVSLALITHRQVGYWRNSRSLFAHAVQVDTNNYVGWQGLGIAELQRHDSAAALTNFTRALACNRAHGAVGQTLFFTGLTLQLQGKGLEALPYLEQAIVPVEQRPDRDYRLGLSLTAAGRLAEAEAAFRRAIEAKPEEPEFQLGMAALLDAQGQAGEAERLFREVVNRHPELAQAHWSLGEFLMLHNRPAEAEVHYAATLKLRQPDAKVLRAQAAAQSKQGKVDEAIGDLEAALKLEPGHAGANFALAELLYEQGRNQEAVTRYSAALEADPKLLDALNNLAWLLATAPDAGVRNGPRAVELAERVCELTEWKAAFLVGTLAAAQAEAGRFEDACNSAQKAIGLAEAAGQKELADRNRQLLELYRAGKPFHESR